MKNKTIVKIILSLVILAGMIVTYVYSLNFGLYYSAHKTVDIYIGQEFENTEIYELVTEILGTKEVIIQKVELYEDMASISAREITEEQLTQINEKINEKYSVENNIEDIEIVDVANVRGRELVKKYINPLIISFALIIIYIIIYSVICNRRGSNIKITKAIFNYILLVIVVQLVYLALLAITRLEINRLTLPVSIGLYVITSILGILKLKK